MASSDEYQQRQFFGLKEEKTNLVLKAMVDATNDFIMKDIIWNVEKDKITYTII
jgi:hypothetical protein